MHTWQGCWKFKYKQVLTASIYPTNYWNHSKTTKICGVSLHIEEPFHLTYPKRAKHVISYRRKAWQKHFPWEIVTWTRWKEFILILVKFPELLVYSTWQPPGQFSPFSNIWCSLTKTWWSNKYHWNPGQVNHISLEYYILHFWLESALLIWSIIT